MKWLDGTSYVGEFKENNIHGFGTYYWKDHNYEGDWVNN